MKHTGLMMAAALACLAPSGGSAAPSGVEIVGDVRFTVITPQLIRIEQAKDGKFVDEPSMFAINRSARFTGYKVTSKDGMVIIDTGVIRLTYRPDGKPIGPDNLQASIRKGASVVEWKPGAENKGNLGGTERTLDGWNGARKLSDGLISRDGWFVIDDSKRHLLTADWVKQRPESAGTDWYLFGYGDDYKAALKSLTAVGGAVPMPRRYALGSWYSRYWAYTSDDYRKIVAEYSEHDFPLDVMVMDMDWHVTDLPGVARRAYANMIWTGYTWNRKLLPDAEDLLKWFHKEGLAVTLNDHPADGVQSFEECYSDFMKAIGKDPATKEEIPFDAGDKSYMDAFWKYTHEDKIDAGVDFWWLDWQQYPDTRSIPGLTNLAWLNSYFYQHTGKDGKRGLSFSRWAGWGDHRHPIHFSGDSYTDWKMLAAEVPFTSTAGNVACFFWSHDIRGHMGARNEESYTRWCQFGATTAALRSHSTRDETLDRRPWTYPKWAENSMRISFHLRSELFPYIYSSAWQSCKDSIPLNRPMYIEYPNDERAYKNGQQYFFGDNLLAAPITMPGVGPDRVGWQAAWLPSGVWYNWFDGERYEGNQEILAAAAIDEFPLFARGGVPIPMQPYTERMATSALDTLIVRCYPGPDGKTGKFTLYEDDGLTQGYMNNERATTELSYTRRGSEVTVKIGAAKGSYKGQPKSRGYMIELPGTAKATSVTVDGKPSETEYDEKTFTNRITVPSRSIRKGCVIAVTADSADFKAIRLQAIAKRAGLKSADSKIRDINGLLKAALPTMTTPEQQQVLLAACGIGLVGKNETPYFYPDQQTVLFYAPDDALGNGISLWVPDADAGGLALAEHPKAPLEVTPAKDRSAEVELRLPDGQVALKVERLQGP